MNVFKIAWRSIQYRGTGSALTILSMALGVMMVVAVLSIYGLVQSSFRGNNSFGYNIIVGARGGGTQLTMNSVYYLSRPVENIPYEYYLAFCDKQTRQRELKNSIAYQARESSVDTAALAPEVTLAGGAFADRFANAVVEDAFELQQDQAMGINRSGMYSRLTHVAVPLSLGDYYVDPKDPSLAFRCVGTTPQFFTDIVLDVETEATLTFSEGRAFEECNSENGFFECVIGRTVARRTGLKLGDRIQATHGDPTDESAHVHEQEYTIVGILDGSGTPNDRAVFLNLEGFFLMEDHAKPIADDNVLKTNVSADDPDDASNDQGDSSDAQNNPIGSEEGYPDPFEEDESFEEAMESVEHLTPSAPSEKNEDATEPNSNLPSSSGETEPEAEMSSLNTRIPLPIEQREVSSILVRTSKRDQAGTIGLYLPGKINEGDLETTLNWSPFRPARSQKASQAVNPVQEVTRLFDVFVNPIRILLLFLTSMICVVSALSIIVGIYNSMNQRQGEIAVMRALGASRSKVMMIILCEAVLLAVVGGLIGWVSGHALNAALGPLIEARTGVEIGFFDFVPAEFLVIPVLIVLAVVVGIYPARAAYKTDVAKSLGK